MLFYPSKTNDRLNARPFYPEAITRRVMLNPNYPIRRVLPGTSVFEDSGAFQDIDRQTRLQPWAALDRQLRHWNVIELSNDYPVHFEALVIYDQMAGVDECLVDGKKMKKRGNEETARPAIAETLRSAAYYATQRHRMRDAALCFVGQGVTPEQYITDCVVPMLDIMRPGDWFAFGGLCIWGKMPKQLTPLAHETIARTVPLLKRHGIVRFHLLGVTYAPAVEWVAALARRERVTFSTDGSGPEQTGAIAGKRYVNGRQVRAYAKEQKWTDYHPHDLAMENIQSYHDWSSGL